MNNDYENIVPWNGGNDTGKDVRLKLERNFEKVSSNFKEVDTNLKTLNQLFKLKETEQGERYAYTDLPIVTRFGLITYNDDGTINLPDLYAGLPLDGTTIGRDSSGALTVLGGVGSDFDATKMWNVLSGSGAEQINKSHLTDALVGYARTSDIPSLSGYATESWVNNKGYVTTTRLNELIGGASSAFDTLKEIEDYINSHESVTAGLIASLGNKVDKVTGMGLSEHSFTTALRDKLNSISEGANKYILPVAKAAVLGGVMIGSNINVNAQGVISVDAPYSHPTQKAINAGAARHFLTDLAVNEYGHVTSATSAALTKDDLLSVLKDEDGVIRLDAQLALTGSLINFANLGTVNIPSLYDGIPVDGKSIYWENGTLKSSSTGGGGLAKVIVKIGLAAYESVDGVVTLPAYPTMPDLSGYVTTNTNQDIWSQKNFKYGFGIGSGSFGNNGFFEGTGDGATFDTYNFHLKGWYGMAFKDYADNVTGIYNFRNGLLTLNGGFARTGGTSSQFLKADGSVDSNAYVTIYHDHSYVRTGDYRDRNPVGFSNQTFTPFFLSGGKIGLTGYCDAMYLNTYSDASGGKTNLLAVSKVSGSVYRMMVDQGAAAWNGTLVEMLDTNNWRSIIDGRYLPVTGGTVTGEFILDRTSGGYMRFFRGGSNLGYIGQGSSTNDGLRFQNDISTKSLMLLNSGDIIYGGSRMWHAGNDGAGSGLDADLLDGYHIDNVLAYKGTLHSNVDYNALLSPACYFNQIGNGTSNANYHLQYGVDLVFGGDYYVSQLQHGANNSSLVIRQRWDGVWSSWRNIAFEDGNIASANKLRTPRKIFGQEFDGTNAVDGVFRNIVGTPSSPIISHKTLAHQSSPYGLITRIWAGGEVSLQAQRESNDSEVFPLLLNTNGGNVGIGIAAPSYKLHVAGDIYSTNTLRTELFLLSGQDLSIRGKRALVGDTSRLFINYANDFAFTDIVGPLTVSGNIDVAGNSHFNQKVIVDRNRFSSVASPSISLAIGDTDTGFDWASDGVYKIKSDGIDIAQVSQDRFHLYKKLVIESNEGNYCEGIRIKASSSNWSTIALGAVGEFGTSENMWSIHRTADNNFAIARNDSSGVNGMFIGKNGYIGFGTVSPTCKMEIHGAIKAVNGGIETNHSVYAGDAVYAGGRIFTGFDSGYSGSISCSNWFRGNGATGWINETYGGGIYMTDLDQVRVYGNKVLYNDGYRTWGIAGHRVGLKLYNPLHTGINLSNDSYTWGIYSHWNGNMYIGRRSGNINDESGEYYLIIGAGTMTYNGSIVLNGGGLITYSSDIRLKEIQEYFNPSLSELAALPIFAHSWRNGTPGVQLSTSAQAVQKIMPWNVFEGDDGYLKMDGTRTALAVSIRLAQLANEYITNNERWKSDKDRQIEALQREVRKLKQKLNAA